MTNKFQVNRTNHYRVIASGIWAGQKVWSHPVDFHEDCLPILIIIEGRTIQGLGVSDAPLIFFWPGSFGRLHATDFSWQGLLVRRLRSILEGEEWGGKVRRLRRFIFESGRLKGVTFWSSEETEGPFKGEKVKDLFRWWGDWGVILEGEEIKVGYFGRWEDWGGGGLFWKVRRLRGVILEADKSKVILECEEIEGVVFWPSEEIERVKFL
jgi:hypothetical protein